MTHSSTRARVYLPWWPRVVLFVSHSYEFIRHAPMVAALVLALMPLSRGDDPVDYWSFCFGFQPVYMGASHIVHPATVCGHA